MSLLALEGQGVSGVPMLSGAPTVCVARTQGGGAAAPPAPGGGSASSAARPTRHSVIRFSTAYAESVICTPTRLMREPAGPSKKGTQKSVRPSMAPFSSPLSAAFISAGAFQLLVGPASDCAAEQMKVRLSRRATCGRGAR